MSKQITESNDINFKSTNFLAGFALALSEMLRQGCNPSAAESTVSSAGISLQEFEDAGIAQFDFDTMWKERRALWPDETHDIHIKSHVKVSPCGHGHYSVTITEDNDKTHHAITHDMSLIDEFKGADEEQSKEAKMSLIEYVLDENYIEYGDIIITD